MPSRRTRRTFLGALAGFGTVGSAGCLGGNDHGTDDTKKDYLVLAGGDEPREVSILLRQDGERVAGGRYRVPKNTSIYLSQGFEWGTYTVLGKRPREEKAYEHWQSWTWEPQSCATGEYTNDDGYWTGTVRVGKKDLGFSYRECPTEVSGLGGGGGRRPVEVDDHRLGDVTDAPPTTTTD